MHGDNPRHPDFHLNRHLRAVWAFAHSAGGFGALIQPALRLQVRLAPAGMLRRPQPSFPSPLGGSYVEMSSKAAPLNGDAWCYDPCWCRGDELPGGAIPMLRVSLVGE